MPEGDTIHFAANRMRPVLIGAVPEQLLTPHARLAPQRWPQRLAGRRVSAIDAHGKHLFIRFEGGMTVHSHLRMSGAWAVHRQGQAWHRSAHRAWLVIARAGVEVVQFDGPLLELRTDASLRSDRRLRSLGQDVLAEGLDESPILARLHASGRSRAIGQALLDQRVIAGIGNVWKSEACFAVGVSPWRAVAEVLPEEALAIVSFARAGMARCAVEGPRARPRAVYKRAGLPCERCRTRLRSARQGDESRVTFWCPGCQR